jgi:hypothetical protein
VSVGGISPEELVLVELSQWLARVAQYSPHHPACTQPAERTQRAIGQALAVTAPLTYGILRTDVMIGETAATHPAVKGRLASHLHARGVLMLRIASGVTVKEMSDFVELLTVPVQALYDRGGLLRLAREKGIARVLIDEFAHDVTTEERDAQKRRSRLRDRFREILANLLAQRGLDVDAGAQLAELLTHPDIAVIILEEDPAGLAEAAAGLALITRQEETRGAIELRPKLCRVFRMLGPQARERLLIGFPALVGDFRNALAWAIEGFEDEDLAHLALPAIRARGGELDVPLYALTAAVPGEGRRLAALRWLGLALMDLPADDSAAAEVLAALARPAPEYDSFRKERDCLREHALRATDQRTFAAFDQDQAVAPPGATPAAPAPAERAFGPISRRNVVAEVVRLAAKRRGELERLARLLPVAADTLLEDGEVDVIVGAVRGLTDASKNDASGTADEALRAIGGSGQAPRLLTEIDRSSSATEGDDLDDTVVTLRLLVAQSPAAALERLDQSESRKMRRLLLEALPLAGASILPLVRGRLRSPSWFVVRNAVVLVMRCGGTARDIDAAARHPNEKVRMEVARALRSMTIDEAATDIVVRYLTDASHEVRLAARGLLRGELVSQQSMESLEIVADDDAESEELRRTVIAALGKSAHDGAAEALFRLLEPKGLIERGATATLRDATAEALRASPAPKAVALFKEGLSSSNRRVRKACERAAGGA